MPDTWAFLINMACQHHIYIFFSLNPTSLLFPLKIDYLLLPLFLAPPLPAAAEGRVTPGVALSPPIVRAMLDELEVPYGGSSAIGTVGGNKVGDTAASKTRPSMERPVSRSLPFHVPESV